MKKIFTAKPITLSETAEHRIHTRKWWAIVILIIGGVMLAGRLPLPYSLAYFLLLFGHLGMLHTFYDKRDIPMMVVNAVWVVIDALGFIRWWNM
jgi:hypothetical protein